MAWSRFLRFERFLRLDHFRFAIFAIFAALCLLLAPSSARAAANHCPATVNGTVLGGTMSRFALDKTPSVCGTAKPFPGTTASQVRYTWFAFENRTAANACVNVTVTATSGEVQAAAYLNTFNVQNLALNYLGDPGTTASALTGSTHPTTSFAINVPSLAPFDILVQETVNGAGATFSLQVEGCGELLARSISLPYGPVDGGETVSISGAGFLPGATVTLGGVPLTSVNVTDATITGVTGAHAAGAVDVVVTNPDGTSSTLTGGYAYMNRAPSGVGLLVNPTSAVFGQNISLSANVTGSNPPATVQGVVTFFDGATSLGTAFVAAGGTATFNVATLAAGTHSLSASFNGGSFFTPSTSSPVSVAVARGPTVTTVMSSNAPINAGSQVTFTANVKAQDTGTPSGNVQFSDGATVLGTSPLSGGAATWTTSTLTPGSHTITANYEGDSNFLVSAGTLPVLVEVGTTIVNINAPTPVTFGNPVTASVTVQGGFAQKTPTGTITFSIGGGVASQVVPLDSQGQASVSWNGVAVGTWTLTAQYSGDTWNGPGTGSASVFVAGPQSTITIASSQNPAPVGSTVLITISVAPVAGGATANGSVDVFDALTGITNTLTVANGQAVYTMVDPQVGDHLLEVSFRDPSQNLQPSSNDFTQSVYVPQVPEAGTPDATANGDDAGPTPENDAGPVVDAGVDSGTTLPRDGGTHDAGQGTVSPGGGNGPDGSLGRGEGDLPQIGPVASSGCACDVTGGPSSSPLSAVALGAAVLGLGRRRRRSAEAADLRR